MQSVVIDGWLKPNGHYSPAIIHERVVYVSGQLPIDPQSGRPETGSIEAQVERVMLNLGQVLEAAQSGLGHLLQVTVYTPDIALWDRINAVYARFLGEHRPARVVVPTTRLHFGCLVEIAAIAAQRVSESP